MYESKVRQQSCRLKTVQGGKANILPTMSFAEFLELIKDAGLLGGLSAREIELEQGGKSQSGAASEELTMEEVQAAFNGAQHDFCDFEVEEGQAAEVSGRMGCAKSDVLE